jgi:hypothetical protein
MAVEVRQLVRSAEGARISDDRLVHVYTFRNGLIAGMEIVEEPDAR